MTTEEFHGHLMAALHGPHAMEIAQRVADVLDLDGEFAKASAWIALLSMHLVAQEKARHGAGSRTAAETMRIVAMEHTLLQMVTAKLHAEIGPVEAMLGEDALEKLRAAGILPKKEKP